MATIKPFIAIRPKKNGDAFAFLTDEAGIGFEQAHLKKSLKTFSADEAKLLACSAYLTKLLRAEHYVKTEREGLYVYECSDDSDSHTGVFALTSLTDLEKGIIFTHEHTLATVEENFLSYRENVGLEAGAILLTYEPVLEIDSLIKQVKAPQPDFFYHIDGVTYQFWSVTAEDQLKDFIDAFANINQVFLADGHHRLRAAEQQHRKRPQFISTLYLSTKELDIQPFHRLIIPDQEIAYFIDKLSVYFVISTLDSNVPFIPTEKNSFGMCLAGTWYQLNLRDTFKSEQLIDAEFLQEKIFAGIFGVNEPRTDLRLRCFAAKDWAKMLAELSNRPTAIAFTLFPIAIRQFIQLSLAGRVLPPKSTSFEPKAPFGLLMRQID